MAALPSVADLLSGQTGYERGAQAFDNGYNGVRGMRVNDLAKSYFTGDPSTRDATLQQIAAINPQAADNISKWTMGQENQRNMQLANIARGVLSFKDPAAQRGVYQNTIMPAAKRQSLQIPEWDDVTTPQWLQYQLASSGNQAGQGVQSTYVDGEGNRVAILRNGATQILGKNDAGANQQTLSIDVNGVPTQVTFDRRTGRYTNAALGGNGQEQAPPPGLYQTPNGPVHIDGSLTPDQWQAVQADVANRGGSDQYQLPQREVMPQQTQGVPLVGRTKEAEAAAVESAKQQAQMQYLPQELGMRTQAAIQQAQGTTAAELAAKSSAEQQQAAAQRSRDANDTISLLDQAEKLLPEATGGRAGNIRDTVAGAFGVSTQGAQATAALQTIAGQLTSKMPRMQGPQSDRDVQLYQQMAGDLANANLPVETRLAALRQIRALNQKYAVQQGGQSRVPAQPGNYSNLWK